MIRRVLLSFSAGVAAVCGASMTEEEATKNIRAHVESIQTGAGKDLCTLYSCCNITTGESCSISNMPKDQTTLVLPGGETRCIYSYSTPFAFQVIIAFSYS